MSDEDMKSDQEENINEPRTSYKIDDINSGYVADTEDSESLFNWSGVENINEPSTSYKIDEIKRSHVPETEDSESLFNWSGEENINEPSTSYKIDEIKRSHVPETEDSESLFNWSGEENINEPSTSYKIDEIKRSHVPETEDSESLFNCSGEENINEASTSYKIDEIKRSHVPETEDSESLFNWSGEENINEPSTSYKIDEIKRSHVPETEDSESLFNWSGEENINESAAVNMEGFLHHMAPQFLHPALQSFGCGAFRPIGGSFHPLYPGKAFARHLGEQYVLGQSVGQALRSVRDDNSTPPLYRHGYGVRDDTSSPGSAASASPRPCKDEDPPAAATCTDSHDLFSPDGERKSSCGVCGARLGPGVAQAHFLQELQHLYSLTAIPRETSAPSHSLHHQDEDARWETYQRIRANRQRRLKLRTRKRHHTVESMLGYDLEDERREERPREARTYDAEDEPVDVEGDSLGWPDAAINIDEKEQRSDGDKLHLNYAEDLEISSTNDTMQSPERVRIETPKPLSLECPKTESVERPAEVSTSEWTGAQDTWPALADAYAHARHKIDGEMPSSTDSRN